MKNVVQIVLAMLVAVMMASSAFAALEFDDAVTVESIKVNGDVYEDGDQIKVDLGEELDIRLKIQAMEDVDNIEASARLIGYEYSDKERDSVSDYSDLMDLKAGDTEYLDMSLKIPVKADKDIYELQIKVDGRRTEYFMGSFTVRVAGPRSGLLIRDVLFSPSNAVPAGRSLLTQVRLENIGERDLDDVKITVSMPDVEDESGMPIEAYATMDDFEGEEDLGRGERKTSEEVLLRIPACAKPGTYDVVTTVEFDEDETETKTSQITIVDGGNVCKTTSTATEAKTLITAPSAQTVTIGVGGATYPVVIQNTGATAKTYSVSVVGVNDWGAYQISDQAPVVQGGESKVVYVYVTANEGVAPGVKTFGIDVMSDGAKQSMVAQAVVTEGTKKASVRDYLEIGVIVLVAILIVLGLIVAFNKMKGKNDNDEDDLENKGQAYY
ncbi:MAG TPA: hypothetical protein VK158_00490 [Acidobacteriota bacterium]|nr:hypothetical protein [Acidobacteriota bacterium]